MSSIKDVAKHANVSIATVSRVINNSVQVDENTRLKVERAIKEINYKPNLLATGLRSKKSRLIGLIIPDVLPASFSYIVKYCEEKARLADCGLIIGVTNNDTDIEFKIIEDFISRNVNGIIFSRVSDKSRVINLIKKHKTPIAVIDRALIHEDIHAIVLDNLRAGKIAAEYLLKLGHENFLCVTGPLDIALSRERLSGFSDTLIHHGIMFDSSCFFEGDFKYESGVSAAEYVLRTKKNVTAVWAQNDLMALGFMNTLQRNQVNVPRDISVVGMDDSDLAKMSLPALTTVTQPFKAMCDKALDVILNPELYPEKRIVFDSELIERESVGNLLG